MEKHPMFLTHFCGALQWCGNGVGGDLRPEGPIGIPSMPKPSVRSLLRPIFRGQPSIQPIQHSLNRRKNKTEKSVGSPGHTARYTIRCCPIFERVCSTYRDRLVIVLVYTNLYVVFFNYHEMNERISWINICVSHFLLLLSILLFFHSIGRCRMWASPAGLRNNVKLSFRKRCAGELVSKATKAERKGFLGMRLECVANFCLEILHIRTIVLLVIGFS